MTQRASEQNILEDAWDQVVGGMDWLKSVFFGEFSDHRPLSAVVADMLVSFIPGVVIVTSARDAVAVILRLANHPEKREELMEWVLLSACLIWRATLQLRRRRHLRVLPKIRQLRLRWSGR